MADLKITRASARPKALKERDRLVRLLASYLPVLPAETRAAVLAALPAPEAAALKLTPED